MAAKRPPQPQQKDVEYDFFSFPVFFAFALGALAVFPLIVLLGYYAFLLALFGTSFGVFHLISHAVQRRVLEKRRRQADEEERERRALAARQQASLGGSEASARRRRRRRS
jgi:hypothetical protein